MSLKSKEKNGKELVVAIRRTRESPEGTRGILCVIGGRVNVRPADRARPIIVCHGPQRNMPTVFYLVEQFFTKIQNGKGLGRLRDGVTIRESRIQVSRCAPRVVPGQSVVPGPTKNVVSEMF